MRQNNNPFDVSEARVPGASNTEKVEDSYTE